MNQRSGFRFRHLAIAVNNVGNGAFTTVNVTPNYPKGRLVAIEVTKAGGSGTQVQAQVRENGARLMFDSGALANFGLSKTELNRDYSLLQGQSLQIGLKVDQGNDTNCTVDIVVET